jgi:tRNA(fMet)-specific endonuclease VapC
MPHYLLDTNVLLHWVRNSAAANEINRQFDLEASRLRPLVCEVSWGEMRAFAKGLGWGSAKLNKLSEIQASVVSVDISDQQVLDAYADLQTSAKKGGWPIFNGKNDIWIGAAARAAGATLLTTDSDFKPVRDVLGWQIIILNPKSGLISVA